MLTDDTQLQTFYDIFCVLEVTNISTVCKTL